MSWHFSQAMVAEFSAAAFSDGEPSAPSRTTTQPDSDLSPARTMAACDHSQFGTTSAALTGNPGLDEWMLSLEGSHARTSAWPEQEQGSPASDQVSGANLLGSFARFDPDTSSWRTPQLSLLEGLEQFSETWPRWGLMRDGACWVQLMPAPLTSGSGSGLWPTPRCHDAKTMGPSETGRESPCLAAVIKWPTPTVCGNYNRKGASLTSGDGLATAVAKAMLPTPTVNIALNAEVGGPLNPPWVEWLMGWPIGWTALEALETGRFQQWWHLHGMS